MRHPALPFVALGDAEPELLSPNGVELNVEAVAALDPDLIVGIYSGMTQSEYDLLSAIAPTIAQPSEFVDYGTPCQAQTRIVGRAVGKAQLLDLETVVWIVGDDLALDAILDLPLRESLAFATEGREVFADFELSGAFSFSSPLSIPYLLDELVPKLAAAVDGDPTTTVPEQDIGAP